MQKIKDHQRQQEKKSPDETGVDKFKSDFKSSMGYLQKMISEKKRKRQKKRHRRHTVRYTNNPNVPTGDINKDMLFIQNEFKDIKGKIPENYNSIIR